VSLLSTPLPRWAEASYSYSAGGVRQLRHLVNGNVKSMSTTTTTTRDRGDRYGPIEWAQKAHKRKEKCFISCCRAVYIFNTHVSESDAAVFRCRCRCCPVVKRITVIKSEQSYLEWRAVRDGTRLRNYIVCTVSCCRFAAAATCRQPQRIWPHFNWRFVF